MKRMIFCLMAMMGVLTLSAQSTNDFKTNPVLDNIMARHSVRKYLDKPVEHEKLETVALARVRHAMLLTLSAYALPLTADSTSTLVLWDRT